MQIAQIIGANIRRGREAKGLTQHELAQQIGSRAGHVSRWELGNHRPKDDMLAAIAAVLDMDFVDFYARPEA